MNLRYIGRHRAGVYVSPDGDDNEVFVEHGGEVELSADVARNLLAQKDADGAQWETVKAAKSAKES